MDAFIVATPKDTLCKRSKPSPRERPTAFGFTFGGAQRQTQLGHECSRYILSGLSACLVFQCLHYALVHFGALLKGKAEESYRRALLTKDIILRAFFAREAWLQTV
ncbi:hypothetical protein L596_004639 [Steinernema carpocapsae]|uniref:Uncharacterized protein n=1 Tax=Steinernema carpocapsae TaxID=34508 RepID=A0A4U8V010_STECR|nr:hypothetical protein L596_004639 [Steinernema carpocapsae]